MRSVLKPARRLRIGQVSDAEIIRLMRYCTLETLIFRATAFATSDLATVTFTATPGVFTLTTPAAELECPYSPKKIGSRHPTVAFTVLWGVEGCQPQQTLGDRCGANASVRP